MFTTLYICIYKIENKKDEEKKGMPI